MKNSCIDLRQNALLIVDAQQGFDDSVWWGERNNLVAEQNIAELLSSWRARNGLVIHARHCSLVAGSPLRRNAPGWAFKPEAKPVGEEIIVEKSVNSAFIGTGLDDMLQQRKIERLTVVGFTTDHCVSTTVRMASNLGYKVRFVDDAAATFDRVDRSGRTIPADLVHRVHLASLNGEFCNVIDTTTLLSELAF